MSALTQQGVGVPPSLLIDPCSVPPCGVRVLHGRIQWMIFFVLNSCNSAPANPLINKLIKRTPRGFANCRNQQCFRDSQPLVDDEFDSKLSSTFIHLRDAKQPNNPPNYLFWH
ncbi:hypothetical protein MHYP_G00345070 [Metynnis hypsauchen]